MMVAQKALFRDGSKRLLGGVCAGLSHYFGVNLSLIRVGFLLSTFFFGIAIPLYIITWALIPKARTDKDKARMFGAFESFEKSVPFYQKEQERSKSNLVISNSILIKSAKFFSLALGLTISFFTIGLAISSPLVLELFWEIKFNSINIYFNPIIGLFTEVEKFGLKELMKLLWVGLPGVILILKSLNVGSQKIANRLITTWLFVGVYTYFFL